MRFTLDGWLVDPNRNRIERGRDRRSIEPQAMKLLVRLAAARGEVVPKEVLLAEVWEGRAVVEHVLPKTISQLRQAFGETGSRPRVILTQPRRGYRLGRPTGRSPEPRAVEAPIRLEPKFKTKI
jgi:DNA-binding winged helix-turn-helix (wHTH) protein